MAGVLSNVNVDGKETVDTEVKMDVSSPQIIAGRHVSATSCEGDVCLRCRGRIIKLNQKHQIQ